MVIGDWHNSPLGEFTNVMLAKSDGTRILFAPSKEHAEYVSSLYSFEDVRVIPINVERGIEKIRVKTDELVVNMEWKRGITLPFNRPKWFIARIENLFAGILFGTKTYGKTNNGRKEWYCVKGISKILCATAELGGESLGEMSDFQINACFGFSEPPRKPSSILVTSMISNN